MNAGANVLIDMEPIGRRLESTGDSSLLEVAQANGIQLVSLCGGIGACRGCMIRLMEGKLSSITLEEEAQLSDAELATGCRLACQTFPVTDVRIDIPTESLSTPQRLQVESEALHVVLNPLVTAYDVSIPPPTITDIRPDLQRLRETLGQPIQAEPAMLNAFGKSARLHRWQVRVALHDNLLVGVLPSGTPLLGLAVDVGSTKLAAYLLNLQTGALLAKAGAMNPQIAFGEDIISRIVYTSTHQDGAQVLQARLIDSLNTLIATLCEESATHPEQIVDAVIVGNTVMHHLLAGLPVEQLGEAPYVASTLNALALSADALGLNTSAGARVYLPPLIAGYVGADHTAMLIATNVATIGETCMVLDIGTNTEITLAHGGRLMSCSCASGPAFEGAHISQGMRAAAGAIERVQWLDGHVRITTIDNHTAIGICGSGILDAVAVMADHHIVDARGALNQQHPNVHEGCFVLTADDGAGRVGVTRKDVSEVQLAKAAIRVGVELLLQEAALTAQDIDQFIIAGAFGSYITVDSAIRIGMFPALPHERFRQVGNAAGLGACQMLLSASHRKAAETMTHHIHYVELTTHPDFQTGFMNHLSLRNQEG